MGRFIGGNIGRAITTVTNAWATSGIYNLADQYWHRKQDRWKEPPLSVTGGVIYTPGNGYRYHAFTAGPHTLEVTYAPGGSTGTFELLAVGAGGCNNGPYRAGSGGGGVVHHTQFPYTVGTPYTINVGATTVPVGQSPGSNGEDTTITHPNGTLTAKGGGMGGHFSPAQSGQPGGSGGGEQDSGQGVGTGIQPSQNSPWTPQTGFNQYGRNGGPGRNTGAYHSGGGGGAGEVGGQAYAPATSASGGHGGRGQPIPGFEYPLIGLGPIDNPGEANSPTHNHYGGGGAGWGYAAQPEGVDRYRAYGGGGAGTPKPGDFPQSGTDGLGGGGGAPGGNGGAGILVIRYQY